MTWLRAKMGLPLLEPYYYTPTISFGLQNLAITFWEATESKILTNSEKDLDSLLLIGQGKASGDPAAPTTDQIKIESEEGDPNPINPTLTIKSTLEGRTVYWSDPHDQTLEELPFQEGP